MKDDENSNGGSDNSGSEHGSSIDQVRRFWHSGSVEKALAPYQVASSIAYVAMLEHSGIVSAEVAGQARDALRQIERELDEGRHFLNQSDADMYEGLTRRVHELGGDSAAILNIGKSPNDHMACDIRLWLRSATIDLLDHVNQLRSIILMLAEKHMEVVMPGYTHMQPATPELLAHWWLANAGRLRRDFARLQDAYKRINLCPLGAGAFAGATQPIDRNKLAELLSFDGIVENSLDAVCDRDYVVEFSSAASLIGVHISQLASELLIWSTQEFGYLRLPGELSFRSQSFPQKRNPQALESLRSRSSLFSGRLSQILNELKGIPVSYSHDLNECLPGLVDVVENLVYVLELSGVVLQAMTFDTKKMHEAASIDAANAGNAMDFLIARGFAPDKARSVVESILSYCKERSKHFQDLAPTEWQQFSPAFSNEIYSYVSSDTATQFRESFGGTALWQVEAALGRARTSLEDDQGWLSAVRSRTLSSPVEDKSLSQ